MFLTKKIHKENGCFIGLCSMGFLRDKIVKKRDVLGNSHIKIFCIFLYRTLGSVSTVEMMALIQEPLHEIL